MIVCSRCNHVNPEGNDNCASCGQPLDEFYRLCPSCGALNPSQSVYCGHCYSELVPASSASEAPDVPVAPYEPPQVTLPPSDFGREPKPQPREIVAPEPEPETPVEAEPPATDTPGEAVSPEAEAPAEPEQPAQEPAGADIMASDEEPVADGGSELPVEQAPASSEPIDRGRGADETEQAPSTDVELPGSVFRDASGHLGPVAPQAGPSGREPTLEPPQVGHSEQEPPAREPAQEPVAAPVDEPGFEPETEADAEPRPEAPQVVRPAEHGRTSSPLQGLPELLPLEAAVSLPHRADLYATEPPDDTGERDARIFGEVASEPAPLHEPATEIEPRRIRPISRAGRACLYIGVLLAVLVPLITGGRIVGMFSLATPASELDSLAGLGEGDCVLVSFDYGPAYAGELDPAAEEIVADLMARSVAVIAMSTRPEGVGLAKAAFDRIAEYQPDLEYGTDYAVVGFLPGQEAGLRSLSLGIANTFIRDSVRELEMHSLPIMQGVTGISDLSHVLVIGDDDGAVRHWIEQVGSRLDTGISAVVSSRVEPMLIPYRESGQLDSLSSGAHETLARTGSQTSTASAAQTAEAQVCLVLLVLLVALAANLGRTERAQRPRRPTSRRSA